MREWKLEPARDHGLSFGEKARSVRRESGLMDTGLHLAWRGFLGAYFQLIHRMRIDGREHLPAEPPFVLVANHSSHLDAPALASALPTVLSDRVFPIAAGDHFFETPATALFASAVLNALPLWRKNCGQHEIDTLRHRLIEEPCSYLLFPEGTRSRTGKMSRFRPGLGMLVAGTLVPVIPAYLEGAFDAMPPWRKLPRPGRLRLRIGEALRFSTTSNDRDGWIEVSSRAEVAVRALGGLS